MCLCRHRPRKFLFLTWRRPLFLFCFQLSFLCGKSSIGVSNGGCNCCSPAQARLANWCIHRPASSLLCTAAPKIKFVSFSCTFFHHTRTASCEFDQNALILYVGLGYERVQLASYNIPCAAFSTRCVADHASQSKAQCGRSRFIAQLFLQGVVLINGNA